MITIIDGVPIEEGSGNVYKDLGYPNAEQMLLKADLTHQLQQTINNLGFTKQQAAEKIGMTESWLSDLLDGQFRNIDEATIIQCLERISNF
ncbi:helix-turn-helix domain-containing protein [Duganella radicis]|uniref:XRE family transcriptional regulator n=1 Tax=Duganella radicis TaxID=551988 RepID=A0A6L6PQJ0_9BURK|nr:XRE family transcriptional regulator [Duganella radicis]MTV41358.1 XRE family transcriptional regulator [Duganella radicis]